MEQFRRGINVGWPVGRLASWLVVVVTVLFSGVVLASGVEAESRDNATANLPDSAESAQVSRLQAELSTAEYSTAIVVFDRGGAELTAADRAAIEQRAGVLAGLSDEPDADARVEPVFAQDGAAAFVPVPVSADTPESELAGPIGDLREAAAVGLPDGLRASVTGGPAFVVDLSEVFDGADVTLLAATAGVVALLLLVTYRSPWLWLVPLAVIGLADQVAATLLAAATHVFGFAADGATTGIASVLVFGAGTNYALLLIARYREELHREESRYDAMRVALRRAAPAIVASSTTVIVSLLTLGLAQSPSSSSIGYGGAIGIATALVFALLVLPAALTVFGRGLFWPFVPRTGEDAARTRRTDRGWGLVAARVTARPALLSVVGVGLLVLLALPLLGIRTGLSQTEQFRAEPESVVGQEVLGRHFPAGSSQPTVVVAEADRADAVREAVAGVDGVSAVRPVPARQDSELVELDVVLTAPPASDQAFAQVEDVREAARSADADALVGGPDAEALDSDRAARADQLLLIPLILGIVLVVLLLLLRSVVAAVLLVLTVVATYAASMGASWWAFEHWWGFPALDLGVPLLAFLFLVALGVDYNIFLATRTREEAQTHDTRTAVTTALAVTGGVITSAGILLAAVFTVLGVLPLITLTQIGVIVGFGVLLDTLLVRTVLVPALVTLLGRRFWWPGALSRQRDRPVSRLSTKHLRS
jgi:RND superfamily putative drug exporter